MTINAKTLARWGLLASMLLFTNYVFATQPAPLPGTYGSATQVGKFTVDSSGKITNAQNVTITLPTSLPPSGAAGGDLSGTYPNPSIKDGAVTFSKIGGGSATAGQLLSTDGAGGLLWASPSSTGALATIKRAVQGIPSTLVDLASIDPLPEGQYVIMAKVTVSSAASTEVDCDLTEQDGNQFTTFDAGSATIPPPPSGLFAAGGTISMLTVQDGAANVHLLCNTASGQPTAVAGGVSLVAVKVSLGQ